MNIKNTAIAKKIVLEVIDCFLEDNGSGAALQAVSTDASNAIRIYASGGAMDSVDITPNNAGDIFQFRDMSNVEFFSNPRANASSFGKKVAIN